jgi:methionyl-tRNA formyltransferase
MKLGVILDNDETISQWQFEALNCALVDGHKIDLFLISRAKALSSKKRLKNLAYYMFALSSRFGLMSLTKRSLAELDTGYAKKIYFDPQQNGIWESLPDQILPELSNIDVIIKFGMGLLAETEKIPTRYGVLSYHHGDPSFYRGRPAGFWESLNSEKIIGVIVQQLSKTLDGGIVRSIGFSKVSQTSYKRTTKDMYATGIPLLRKALKNCKDGVDIAYQKSDVVLKLPSNRLVFKLLLIQFLRVIQRAKYGAFVQKSWSVAKVEPIDNFEKDNSIKKARLDTVPKPEGFTFVADPAGKIHNLIYCELLDSKTGFGEIGIWDSETWRVLDLGISGHKSYPQVISQNGVNYLFPEISGIDSPILFELEKAGRNVISNHRLKGLENTRHVDATLFSHEGYWYLFSGNDTDSEQRLNLYFSNDLFAGFALHPKSPIVLDPRNSRMAGPLQIQGTNIYRFAQNCSERYGSKIQVNRVITLSPVEYSETDVGTVEIENMFGPHTLLKLGQEMWVDYYVEIFDWKAGYRRFVAKFKNFRR